MNRVLAIACASTLCAGAAAVPLLAAAKAPGKAATYTAPRNSLGQPDLTGYWSNVSMTPELRPASQSGPAYSMAEARRLEQLDAHVAEESDKPIDPSVGIPAVGGDKPIPGTRPEFVAAGGGTGGYDRGWLDPGNGFMRVNGQARTGILTTADGKAPPRIDGKTEPPRPPGLGVFDNPEDRPLGERCIQFGRNAPPPMLGNGFYNNDYQIVQTKDEIDIQVEVIHDVRKIMLGGKHRTDGLRPALGDSIGHWEGDTLVVETTNLPKEQAYHGSWKNLTVTERFTRRGPDRLHYAFTIHDPTMWAADWGGEYEFHPMKGIIYEYACQEGNYALEHILAGAREDEKRGRPLKGQ